MDIPTDSDTTAMPAATVQNLVQEADDSAVSMEPQYLVIHTVDCESDGAHEAHPLSASFLDRPRLWTGDSKASALRGKRLVEDVNSYIQQQENICLVVYKNYRCDKYQDEIKKDFIRTKLLNPDMTVSTKVWPFLFTLQRDAREAKEEHESMVILSDELRELLEELDPSLDVRLPPTAPPRSMSPPPRRTFMPPPPPDLYGQERSEILLRAPYLRLYYQREAMSKYIAEHEDEAKYQVLVLKKYLEKELGSEYAEADALFAKGRVSKKHFEKLFGPGQILVAMEQNQPRAYKCTVVESLPPKLKLYGWTWAFDGHFLKQDDVHMVEWPSANEDTIDVTALGIYPLRFDQTGLEERLRARGEKFWGLRYRTFVSYSSKSPSFEIRTTNLRFMIDMKTYQLLHALHTAESTDRDTLSAPAMAEKNPPGDNFSLLLPPTILGYGFHDKKWRPLNVCSIEVVDWNTTAFERLVLDAEKKEIIEALVTVHTKTLKSTDLIEGKGNGLVMLLHGSPGTGKTLTAESVAELTKRPLYRVTCGDMGTNPEAVEKYLESVFHISTIWECVVLLDEADVFLEERSDADLERNALVSVFLRAVEYYDGILILTSNRVGKFDEAFKSRIQLAVHYPSLGEAERRKIWRKFISSLVPEEPDRVVCELNRHIHMLSQQELNGRQIRNTIKSARQLASWKNRDLCFDHFETVLKIADEFENYLVRTRGGYTDNQIALEGNIRAE
ncbi:aaa family atpase [Diplodia corticola]|uniref:Aaa family atpase n=1 Tax=Diplodia corticola TaxID=236234 RepID=A0A1J9QUJ9_9PEZI|nr:aaa family atpase [Diplodia corticola]OJD32646.1 aaa family atpase [Diplodia corticola]